MNRWFSLWESGKITRLRSSSGGCGDQRDGRSDFSASSAVLGGKRTEQVSLAALSVLDETILNHHLADRGGVHQRDGLDLLF